MIIGGLTRNTNISTVGTARMKTGATGRLSASARDGGRSWCMKNMADTNAWGKTEKLSRLKTAQPTQFRAHWYRQKASLPAISAEKRIITAMAEPPLVIVYAVEWGLVMAVVGMKS